VLKITDAARAFYNASKKIQAPSVTWTIFKKTFQSTFRDVRTDQFHFNQLQMARQKKGETPQIFADRFRILAQRTVPQVGDPELQKLHYQQADRMLLASFTAGLAGTPGRQVSFSMPKNLEEALKVAITVDQAELQEWCDQAFYVDPEGGERRQVNWSPKGARSGNFRGKRQRTADSSRRSNQGSRGGESQTQFSGPRKCFACGGVVHFARVCPSKQSHQNTRVVSKGSSQRTTPKRENKAKPQGSQKPKEPKDGQPSEN
jgi:hypothetical protein